MLPDISVLSLVPETTYTLIIIQSLQERGIKTGHLETLERIFCVAEVGLAVDLTIYVVIGDLIVILLQNFITVQQSFMFIEINMHPMFPMLTLNIARIIMAKMLDLLVLTGQGGGHMVVVMAFIWIEEFQGISAQVDALVKTVPNLLD